MNHAILQALDIFFLVFHTCFTLFNMTGWAWRKTRRLHLAAIGLTAFSWFLLGIWYGWGYCFCTDAHARVRELLGRPIASSSYIHFLLLEITGIDFNAALVDLVTAGIFFLCLGLSLGLNLRDFRNRKKHRKAL